MGVGAGEGVGVGAVVGVGTGVGTAVGVLTGAAVGVGVGGTGVDVGWDSSPQAASATTATNRTAARQSIFFKFDQVPFLSIGGEVPSPAAT